MFVVSVVAFQDMGDGTSVSLLNLDPSEDTPEVSPQTRRWARASLSDISSLRDIEGLSVRQLKEILARNFVNYSGCCEKWELVERVSRLYRETEENRKSLENVSSTVTTGKFSPNFCVQCPRCHCWNHILFLTTETKYLCFL